MPRRFQLVTTLYGKRLVSRAQLYELHREVARAAQLARQTDPKYVETQRMGWEISGARSGGSPRLAMAQLAPSGDPAATPSRV